MGIKWKNKEQFFRRLERTVPAMAGELKEANSKSAKEMVDTAKRLAPLEHGALQASIRMSPGPGSTGFTVEAGGPLTLQASRRAGGLPYDYAIAQEFGTQNMHARPFFWPAYRTVRRIFKGRASRAVNKAVKKAGF